MDQDHVYEGGERREGETLSLFCNLLHPRGGLVTGIVLHIACRGHSRWRGRGKLPESGVPERIDLELRSREQGQCVPAVAYALVA